MVGLKEKKRGNQDGTCTPGRELWEEMLPHTRNLLPLLGVSWDIQGESRPIEEWSSWPVAGGAGINQHRRSLSHWCTSHAAQEAHLLVCADGQTVHSDFSGQTCREDSVWLFRDSLRGLDCGVQNTAYVHSRSANVNKHRKGGVWPSLSSHIPPWLQLAWLHH